MHSTQRIEGMQSVAKNVMCLNTRTQLLEIQEAMEAYNVSKRAAMAVNDVRRSLRQSTVVISAAIECMRRSLTTYGYKLVLSQATESTHYRSELLGKDAINPSGWAI